MKLFILTSFLVLAGCALGLRSLPSLELAAPTQHLSLSWENTTEPHPERKPWSEFLSKKVESNLSTLESAKDIQDFCPKYKSLDQAHKIKAISELFVATAYYESAYNPKSSSVDVGVKGNKDTYSVGLLQLSVVDQPNYHLNFGYTYEDLLKAEPNLNLGVSIMTQQIKNYGAIKLDKHVYWATLKIGGKYTQIINIQNRVKTKTPGCT